MAVVTSKVGFTFRDARGLVGRVGMYYNYTDTSTPAGDALLTAQALGPLIHACSNAALIGGFGLGSEVLNPDQYGASASVYETVEDKAKITMICADFSLHTFEIPAPKTAIFSADAQTVNPAATAMVPLLVALVTVDGSGGFPCSKTGSPFTDMIVGIRIRRRLQRKLTIWSLTPTLSGPDE